MVGEKMSFLKSDYDGLKLRYELFQFSQVPKVTIQISLKQNCNDGNREDSTGKERKEEGMEEKREEGGVGFLEGHDSLVVMSQ